MSEPVIGIDLGTTNSCVGIYMADTDSVEIAPNSLGKNTTPSWVGFTQAGGIVVGERARTQPTWIYDAKRMIGKEFSEEDVQSHKNKWDFNVIAGERNRCQIDVPNRGPQSIEQISGIVLQAMKKAAEERLNKPVSKAVVTVPAYFNNA